MNPLDAVTAAVDDLTQALPNLLDACTDPQATDMAELLAIIRDARVALQGVERDTENACAAAMLGDFAESGTVRVERHRSADRKSWDHDAWKHDVRAKAVQAHGLKGAQGVVTADGEVAPVDVLYGLLDTLQSVHGAAAPKSTAMKALGLDVRDYCESSPGAWHVRVTRMCDETEEVA